MCLYFLECYNGFLKLLKYKKFYENFKKGYMSNNVVLVFLLVENDR